MAKKRPYGSGYLKKVRGKWKIRWRELEIDSEGKPRKILRYESLGEITKKEASRILSQRLAQGEGKPVRSRVSFETLTTEWKASVLQMYKASTQKNHRHIAVKHLLPRFGELELSEMTPKLLQSYIAFLDRQGYAPKTIDHIHDVLSAILRTGVNWGYMRENPALGLDMPKLKTIKPKWILTTKQAAQLMENLPILPRTMVGLCILNGLRRGELFALRWKRFDENRRLLSIEEAVYEGTFDTPKTSASVRQLPLSDLSISLIKDWRMKAKKTSPDSLIFATRSGKPISPNNILRRWVFPVCESLGYPRVTWLTFRRTYSSWAHDQGVPHKAVSELMGHSNVYTTLNVYTQTMDDTLRNAMNKIGDELSKTVH